MEVRKIAVVSANLDNFDQPVAPVQQSVPCDFHIFTDENFPPRHRAMTPRLQARLVKMFMWQFVPDYDLYLWVDSSCTLPHPDSVKWFADHLGDMDMAVLRHPHRSTIGEEAEYIKQRVASGDRYLTSRYDNELIDEQMAEIDDPELPLYASTAFICRLTYDIKRIMKEWWYHTSRYHIVDQLALPYVLNREHCRYNVIPDNFMKCKYIKPVRK